MVQSRDKIVLLTLNAHSWMEEDNNFCLDTIAKAIIDQEADVVALQEVNQTAQAREVGREEAAALGFLPAYDLIPLREDNFALRLVQKLSDRGHAFCWTWTYAHRGYGVFDEGLALLSKTPILKTECHRISSSDTERPRYCLRRIPGIKTVIAGKARWFYSMHMGWWEDPDDPFRDQWQRMMDACKPDARDIYLMGDFNAPSQKRDEGYDLIIGEGRFEDLYLRAETRDEGITVPGQIDGWRKEKVDGMRIDMIWSNRPGRTLYSRVIFNGDNYPVVSDHFGVIAAEEASP